MQEPRPFIEQTPKAKARFEAGAKKLYKTALKRLLHANICHRHRIPRGECDGVKRDVLATQTLHRILRNASQPATFCHHPTPPITVRISMSNTAVAARMTRRHLIVFIPH
jgi:hypothetical protein